MNSIYNLVRAQKIGYGDNFFTLYPSQPKTNHHIFFQCYKSEQGWAATTIFYKQQPLNNSLVDAQLILDIIDGNLSKSPTDTTILSLVYHTSWKLWTQHNDRVYNHKHPLFSLLATANQAKEHIAVVDRYNKSHKKRRRLKKATTYITPFCNPKHHSCQ